MTTFVVYFIASDYNRLLQEGTEEWAEKQLLTGNVSSSEFGSSAAFSPDGNVLAVGSIFYGKC